LALAWLAHMDHGEQGNEVQIAMQCLDLEISTRSNLLVGRKLGVEANDVTIALHTFLLFACLWEGHVGKAMVKDVPSPCTLETPCVPLLLAL
jgi:hypothetical protein